MAKLELAAIHDQNAQARGLVKLGSRIAVAG
jgi:hypothetical protein